MWICAAGKVQQPVEQGARFRSVLLIERHEPRSRPNILWIFIEGVVPGCQQKKTLISVVDCPGFSWWTGAQLWQNMGRLDGMDLRLRGSRGGSEADRFLVLTISFVTNTVTYMLVSPQYTCTSQKHVGGLLGSFLGRHATFPPCCDQCLAFCGAEYLQFSPVGF